MGSSGYGPPSGPYLDPDRVFALVIGRRPGELFDYLESVPGARVDLQCRLVSFAGVALLAPRLGSSPPWPDKDSWTLYWAKYAWAHALISRLCAPQMAGYPFNYPSDPVLRHAAILDQLSASSSSTPAVMLPPQQTSYNAVINFPIIRARMLDRTSAFNSGRHASDFSPWGTGSTLELAFAKLSLGQPGSEQMAPRELMQNNHGTPAMGIPSLRQPGSTQITPHRLMQNGEVLPTTLDIKGKGPASEVVGQEVRVHVASLIAKDGTAGAAGLLIKTGTWQFICASCFPMRATEPVLFAAACCEGIKIARAYQPTTIVLESHLFHLLNLLTGAHAPCPQMEELMKLLDPSRCTVEPITKECNAAACELAMHSFVMGVAEIFFSAPPDWLVLT